MQTKFHMPFTCQVKESVRTSAHKTESRSCQAHRQMFVVSQKKYSMKNGLESYSWREAKAKAKAKANIPRCRHNISRQTFRHSLFMVR